MGLGYADGLHLLFSSTTWREEIRLIGCIAVTKCGNVPNGPALTAALLQIVSAGEATPIVFENQRHDNLRCSKAACFQKSLLTKS
jgi:hypothetical protein